MKISIFAIIVTLFLNGCVAEYFTLGKNQSYCEEQGCDYADAGVCDSPFNIIQNKELSNKNSYAHIQCGKGK
jgi:PBP1b-binding outer membrane lipoprotein LpoB